ncbi:MAG: hypothetical protein ACJ8KX_05600, partial [Chthoniobacterales bacterium]
RANYIRRGTDAYCFSLENELADNDLEPSSLWTLPLISLPTPTARTTRIMIMATMIITSSDFGESTSSPPTTR